MVYKVLVTKDAEEDLERFVKYLIVEKKSMQAASNVLDDYDATNIKDKAQKNSVLSFLYVLNLGALS